MSVGQSDAMDGELGCKILVLMRLHDSRMSRACEDLEHAILAFFKQFSKIYIGTNVQKSSKIFTLLAERLGLNDQLMVVDLFVQKM